MSVSQSPPKSPPIITANAFLTRCTIAAMLIPEMTPIQAVNVVVHNPPGMSEFAKTMLSAATGFLFGVASNLLMEFVKPKLEMRRKKDAVLRQVHPEFLQNMNAVNGAMSLLDAVREDSSVDQMACVFSVSEVLKDFRHDRFDQCFEDEKDLVYGIDKQGRLVAFYEKFKEKIGKTKDMSYEEMKWYVNRASLYGGLYLGDASLENIANPHPMVELYLQTIEEQKKKNSSGGNDTAGSAPKV